MSEPAQQLPPPAAPLALHERVRNNIIKHRDKFEAIMPPSMTALFDFFVAKATAEVARNPELQKCSDASILKAIRDAGESGLLIGGAFPEAYMIRYGEEARFMASYHGLLKLARQSGEVKSVTLKVIYANDVHEIDQANEMIVHTSKIGERGDFVGCYAWFHFTNGSRKLETMDKAQVDGIRGRSRASQKGPWVTDYEAMALKTVLRRALKTVPRSTALQRAMDLDQETLEVDSQTGEVTITPAGTTRTQGLVEKLKSLAPEAHDVPELVADAEFEDPGNPLRDFEYPEEETPQ